MIGFAPIGRVVYFVAFMEDVPRGLYRDWADISGFLYDEPSAQERNGEKIKTESFAGMQSQGRLSRCALRVQPGGVGEEARCACQPD